MREKLVSSAGGISAIGLFSPTLLHQVCHTFKPDLVLFQVLLLRCPVRNSFNSPSSRVLEGGSEILPKSFSGGGAGMGTVSRAVLELDSTSLKKLLSKSLLSKSLKGSTSSMAIVRNVLNVAR